MKNIPLLIVLYLIGININGQEKRAEESVILEGKLKFSENVALDEIIIREKSTGNRATINKDGKFNMKVTNGEKIEILNNNEIVLKYKVNSNPRKIKKQLERIEQEHVNNQLNGIKVSFLFPCKNHNGKHIAEDYSSMMDLSTDSLCTF
ncbi:MAG: hypothetical protein N4A74_26035 [Carboxylicivirga sp.]|jgi:hypothetical protein|nr:hypothetical protein [Carboxylicivirga sp.]